MQDIIYCCKITEHLDSCDVTEEFISALEYDCSTWFDVETKIAVHYTYFPTGEEARNALENISRHMPGWKEFGVSIEKLEVIEIKKEDWSEVWKKYFKIQHITERLIVKPSWLEFNPDEKQVVVEIDPGMSFGTGQHPTTSYCLKIIDKLADKNKAVPFLDAGCGSGILSIAAFKLGYRPVFAFDIDPDAVKVAAENIEKNKIKNIKLSIASLEEFSAEGKFDVIAANILSGILIANVSKLLGMLKPGGYIILAGILKAEFDKVAEAFKLNGCSEENRESEGEWTGGYFRKN
jgi:ribosomal protein L11 methyltransferase